MTSPDAPDPEFDARYDAEVQHFVEAAALLGRIVRQVVDSLGDGRLARARLVDEVRMKTRDSLARKAREKGWKGMEVFYNATDLVGARVVCYNMEDVPRLAELLREALSPWVEHLSEEAHDPDETGYRARHLTFRLQLPRKMFGYDSVACEVQIRTLLQDGWARLSHQDIYKQEDVPPDVREEVRHLSDLLKFADQRAQAIREKIARTRSAPLARPVLSSVTPEGIAYLYRATFGKDPAEWLIAAMTQACAEAAVIALEPVEKILADDEFRTEVRAAYRHIAGIVGLSNEELFLAAPIGAARGIRAAVRRVRQQARREQREAEGYWRREVLGDLPESIDDFLAQFDDADADVPYGLQQLAEALGAARNCDRCGADIIDPDEFEAQLSERYGVDPPDGRVGRMVRDSGVEVGDFDNSSLCSYCGHVTSKDD